MDSKQLFELLKLVGPYVPVVVIVLSWILRIPFRFTGFYKKKKLLSESKMVNDSEFINSAIKSRILNRIENKLQRAYFRIDAEPEFFVLLEELHSKYSPYISWRLIQESYPVMGVDVDKNLTFNLPGKGEFKYIVYLIYRTFGFVLILLTFLLFPFVSYAKTLKEGVLIVVAAIVLGFVAWIIMSSTQAFFSAKKLKRKISLIDKHNQKGN